YFFGVVAVSVSVMTPPVPSLYPPLKSVQAARSALHWDKYRKPFWEGHAPCTVLPVFVRVRTGAVTDTGVVARLRNPKFTPNAGREKVPAGLLCCGARVTVSRVW